MDSYCVAVNVTNYQLTAVVTRHLHAMKVTIFRPNAEQTWASMRASHEDVTGMCRSNDDKPTVAAVAYQWQVHH